MKQISRLPDCLMIGALENAPDKMLDKTLAHFAKWARARALKAGFLLRDYHHPERAQIAHALAKQCQTLNIDFFVAGDARLAQKLHARLHLPEGLAHKRFVIRPTLVAAHSARAICRAQASGAEGVLISPVFAPHSHKTDRDILGQTRFLALARLARALNLTPYALGGMTERRARALGARFAAINFFS